MTLNFTPPPGDMAVKVLSALFGDRWWGAIYGQAAGGTFIYDLVTSMNAIAFAALGLILTYVVVNSAVATTSEGIAMGKRYHSFWVPFRSTIATGLIAPLPTAKSLCLLQAIVLLFAYYGIGFADSLYSTGLNAIAQNSGSLYSQFETGKTSPGATSAVVSRLLRVAAADIYLQYRAGYSGGIPERIRFSGPYQDESTLNLVWWGASDLFGNKSFPFAPTRYRGTLTAIPPGGGTPVVVGSVDITCATPRGEEFSGNPNIGTCGAQERAINAVWPQLVEYAGGLVGELPNQDPGQSRPPPSDAIELATASYSTSLETGVVNWVRDGRNGAFQFMHAYSNFIASAKNTGWAYAGVYYWQILRANSYVNNLLHNKPKVSDGQSDLVKALADDPDYQLLSDKVAMLIGVGLHDDGFISPEAYLALRNSTHRASGTLQYVGWRMTDAIHQVKAWEIAAINTATLGLLGKTVGSIGGPTGGLIQVKNAGDIMLDIGAGLRTADFTAGVLSAIPFAGKVLGPVKAVTSGLSPVADMLILEGIGLAYIAPAIPFAFMALVFLTWVIFLIEAWIAAPLWGIAHALPDGEGFAGMRAQAGYMMFLNLLIKPPLIVIGFFAALLLANVMIWFVSAPFMDFVKIMQANTMTGLFALGALLFIYTGLVVAIVYKSYGLITIVPDKVPSWLGQLFRNLSTHVGEGSVAKSLQGGKTADGLMKGVNAKTGEALVADSSRGSKPGNGGPSGAGAKYPTETFGSDGGTTEGATAATGEAAGAAAGAAGSVATGGASLAATEAVKQASSGSGTAAEGVRAASEGIAGAGKAASDELESLFDEMNDGSPNQR